MRRLAMTFTMTALLVAPLAAFGAKRPHRGASNKTGELRTRFRPRPETPKEEDTTQPQASSSPRRPTRLDFDDRLIQGQTNKSGAVYLYDRKELQTTSMVKKRDSFREEIVSGVYGQ